MHFEDFLDEIEAEAHAQGPDAVAELEAFRLHFSVARQLSTQLRCSHRVPDVGSHDHRTTDPTSALGRCLTAGVSDSAIARAAGAQPDAVHDWIAGHATPPPREAERLTALACIAERLARLVKLEDIAAWLATANPTLGGDAPLDRIAADDHRAVARLVSGLEDPGAS